MAKAKGNPYGKGKGEPDADDRKRSAKSSKRMARKPPRRKGK